MFLCCWLLCVVFWGKFSHGLLRTCPELRGAKLLCLSPLHLLENSSLFHRQIYRWSIDRSPSRFRQVRGQLFHWPSSWAHLVQKSSSNLPSPHLHAVAEAISLAPRQDWWPQEQCRQGETSAIVLDSFCGHHLMIWRPSGMVSIVMGVLCAKYFWKMNVCTNPNFAPM
jgi:HPt (histidine-containing phosphotransfer) domain-containing protein